MNAVAEETMLSAELWLSFASVVRAYGAFGAADVTAAGCEIVATVGTARLELRCDLPGVTGKWRLVCADALTGEGRLELLPEGRIAVDGKPLDLDHAAIDLVALVKSAGSTRDEG